MAADPGTVVEWAAEVNVPHDAGAGREGILRRALAALLWEKPRPRVTARQALEAERKERSFRGVLFGILWILGALPSAFLVGAAPDPGEWGFAAQPLVIGLVLAWMALLAAAAFAPSRRWKIVALVTCALPALMTFRLACVLIAGT